MILHKIFYRIKQDGLRKGLTYFYQQLNYRFQYFWRKPKAHLQSKWQTLMWFIPGLALWFTRKRLSRRQKKLLLIWDAQSFPYTIGDIIGLNHYSLCLREEFQTSETDIAFVCDPSNPRRDIDPIYRNYLNEYNYHYHLNALIPLAQINQHFGSLLFFNNYPQLNKYIADNLDNYVVWPSGHEYMNKVLSYLDISRKLVPQFYRKHGHLPELHCKPVMQDWAKTLYRKKILPNIPVTVSLRVNKNKTVFSQTEDPKGNADLQAWVQFFKACQDKYPVTFVIISSIDEIPDELFDLPNVFIPKRYLLSAEQDMALVDTSPMHIGNGGGAWMMVLQSKKPYILFSESSKGDEWFSEWANDNQVYISEPQTSSLIAAEFEKLFQRLDFSQWLSDCRQSHEPLRTPFQLGMGDMNTDRKNPYPVILEEL